MIIISNFLSIERQKKNYRRGKTVDKVFIFFMETKLATIERKKII